MDSEARTDVLIVGAGPVGLTLAVELGRRGVGFRIIDRLPQPSPWSRAAGVTPRTLEVLDLMGLAGAVLDRGCWVRGMVVIVNGAEVQRFEGEIPGVPYQSLCLPQDELEALLIERLLAMRIAVERGTELVGIEVAGGDGGVRAAVRDGDGREGSVGCRYLVGCDGAHSATRHALGLAFDGERYPEWHIIGDATVEGLDRHDLVYRFLRHDAGKPAEGLVAVPLPGRQRFRIGAPADAQQSTVEHGLVVDRAGPDLAALQAQVERLGPPGMRVTGLHWSATYAISRRIVERYQKGPVFLAGDAAHIHPPTGGQGMNTGIQDAWNLGWKLALVCHGLAGPTLLDSYDAERRPIGVELVERKHREAEAQRKGRPPLDDITQVMIDTQLLLGYRHTPWVQPVDGDPDPLSAPPVSGDRAPDVPGLRRAGVGHPWRLFDLLRSGRFALLLFPRDAMEPDLLQPWADLVRAHAGLLDGHVILPANGDPRPELPLPVLVDAEGGFAAAYGAADQAWLVRPDGYIAWRDGLRGAPDMAGYFDRLVA